MNAIPAVRERVGNILTGKNERIAGLQMKVGSCDFCIINIVVLVSPDDSPVVEDIELFSPYAAAFQHK